MCWSIHLERRIKGFHHSCILYPVSIRGSFMIPNNPWSLALDTRTRGRRMSDVSGNGIVLIEIGFIRFGPDQQTKWAKHQFKIRYSFIVYKMDLGIRAESLSDLESFVLTQYEMETMRNAERNDAVCCSKVLSVADFTSWRLIKIPGSHLSPLLGSQSQVRIEVTWSVSTNQRPAAPPSLQMTRPLSPPLTPDHIMTQ